MRPQAFAAIFGEHDADSPYAKLVSDAMEKLPGESAVMGDAVSLLDRERGSLGVRRAGLSAS
jgi:hypothetical protein